MKEPIGKVLEVRGFPIITPADETRKSEPIVGQIVFVGDKFCTDSLYGAEVVLDLNDKLVVVSAGRNVIVTEGGEAIDDVGEYPSIPRQQALQMLAYHNMDEVKSEEEFNERLAKLNAMSNDELAKKLCDDGLFTEAEHIGVNNDPLVEGPGQTL